MDGAIRSGAGTGQFGAAMGVRTAGTPWRIVSPKCLDQAARLMATAGLKGIYQIARQA